MYSEQDENNVNYISIFSTYRAVNTSYIGHEIKAVNIVLGNNPLLALRYVQNTIITSVGRMVFAY